MKKVNKYIFLIITILSLTSCVKDLDFNQAENFTLEPKAIASLVYFKIPSRGFIDTNDNEVTEISDETIIDNIITKELVEAELDFEITNPFDRNFTIDFQFLDENNNLMHTIPTINVPANSPNLTEKRTIVVADSPQFLNSKKIKVTIRMSTATGTPINPNEIKDFIFKSAGTFTFKITS
ncbi:hypothetical protein [Tenacibaculum holothuriorum]|uniref:hypothetical protein n=1 Tax=Tenacibaculum holothuriorum TaxID=1635173 RepID=UPI000A3210F3|nr:hypothetical protein [Tenacibaculum holothuriorum]